MQTAEPDVTGTAYDKMNSLIYLDDIQGAPNIPEGAKKPSFLMSMLEMAPGYNPIQNMMEAETMAERARQLPTFLIGLGAIAGGGKGQVNPMAGAKGLSSIKKVKKFVEDWFTSPGSKKRTSEIMEEIPIRSFDKEIPPFSSMVPPSEGMPVSQAAYGNPLEMVTERIEQMRKADLPELLRYRPIKKQGADAFSAHWAPPPKGSYPHLSEEWSDYKSISDVTKRLGRITVHPILEPTSGMGQSVLAHEFTHMAEGGWYNNELRRVIKPNITYDTAVKGPKARRVREYLSQPREILARIMQLRYDYFTRLNKRFNKPMKEVGQGFGTDYRFEPIGDDFTKFFERKDKAGNIIAPTYFQELRLVFSKKDLQKMINTLPATAAVLSGASAMRQGNATSK